MAGWIPTVGKLLSAVTGFVGGIFGGGDSDDKMDPGMKRRFNELARQNQELVQSVAENQKRFAKVQQIIEQNEEQRLREQQKREQEVRDLKRKYDDDAAVLAKALENTTAAHEAEIRRADEQRAKDNEQWAQHLDRVRQDNGRLAERMSVDMLGFQLESQIQKLSVQCKEYGKLRDQYAREQAGIMDLQSKVFAEEARLSEFIDLRHDQSCMRVVLYGETGHGKSSTACRLVGDRSDEFKNGGFPVSNSTMSETQTINAVVVNPYDSKVKHLGYEHNFLVIDQPGTGDTGGETVAMQHRNRMIQYLKGIDFINLVGVVHSGMDPRLSDGTKSMLRELHSSFGERIWPHVCLIITKVRSIYDYPDGDERGRKEQARIEEWIQCMRCEIRAMFGLGADISPLPSIIISNVFERDYTEKCRALINTVAARFEHNPFRCDDLVSPLDEWKSEVTLKDNQLREIRADLTKSVKAVNVLIGVVNATGKELKSKGSSITPIDKCITMGITDFTLLCPINLDEVLNGFSLEPPSVDDPRPVGLAPELDEKQEERDSAAPMAFAGLNEGNALYEGLFDNGRVGGGGSSDFESRSSAVATAVDSQLLKVSRFDAFQPAPVAPAATLGAADGEADDDMDDELKTVLLLSVHDK